MTDPLFNQQEITRVKSGANFLKLIAIYYGFCEEGGGIAVVSFDCLRDFLFMRISDDDPKHVFECTEPSPYTTGNVEVSTVAFTIVFVSSPYIKR